MSEVRELIQHLSSLRQKYPICHERSNNFVAFTLRVQFPCSIRFHTRKVKSSRFNGPLEIRRVYTITCNITCLFSSSLFSPMISKRIWRGHTLCFSVTGMAQTLPSQANPRQVRTTYWTVTAWSNKAAPVSRVPLVMFLTGKRSWEVVCNKAKKRKEFLPIFKHFMQHQFDP